MRIPRSELASRLFGRLQLALLAVLLLPGLALCADEAGADHGADGAHDVLDLESP